MLLAEASFVSDCHAKASNGELTLANGGEALYKKYISDIAAIIKSMLLLRHSSHHY